MTRKKGIEVETRHGALTARANLYDPIHKHLRKAAQGREHKGQKPNGDAENAQHFGDEGQGLFLNLRHRLKQRDDHADHKPDEQDGPSQLEHHKNSLTADFDYFGVGH